MWQWKVTVKWQCYWAYTASVLSHTGHRAISSSPYSHQSRGDLETRSLQMWLPLTSNESVHHVLGKQPIIAFVRGSRYFGKLLIFLLKYLILWGHSDPISEHVQVYITPDFKIHATAHPHLPPPAWCSASVQRRVSGGQWEPFMNYHHGSHLGCIWYSNTPILGPPR